MTTRSKARARAVESAAADIKTGEIVPLAPPAPSRPGLLARMAERYGLDPQVFERTVFATCMPANASREEFIACMMIAHEHGLNPLVKEIYFMRTKSGVIQPIVGVDGWVSKAHKHPHFKGFTFNDLHDAQGGLKAIECTLHRSDLDVPVKVTEYMAECRGDSPAWKKTPARMLRHRALTQAVRYGVGFAGVMDRDEFDQWQGGGDLNPAPRPLSPLADERVIEHEAEPAMAQGFDVDGFLATLDAALSKATTQGDLIKAWGAHERTVEGELPSDQRQRAFDLYTTHETRIAKA